MARPLSENQTRDKEVTRIYNTTFQARKKMAMQLVNGKTYGEIWVSFITHPKRRDFGFVPPSCPRRMKYDEAVKYYGDKLKKVWNDLSKKNI